MDLNTLTKLMVEHGLVIRAIPKERAFGVPVDHKDRYSDEARYTIGEVFKPDNLGKELIKVTEKFSQGGKFIIAMKGSQDSKVQGWEWHKESGKKVAFYDTIEEAVNSVINKP